MLRNNWTQWAEHRAAPPSEKAYRQTLHGALMGYHDTDKPVIADKGRSWIHLLELADFALGEEMKVIVPVRDLAEVLASFESLYRKNAHRATVPTKNFRDGQTVEGRVNHWATEGEVGIAYDRIRDLIARGHRDRVLFVDFDELCADPATVMARVWRYLGMTAPAHDFENVVQVTHEDDEVHGYAGMHDIRRAVRPVPKKAHQILGQSLADKYVHIRPWLSGAPSLADSG